LLPGQRFIEPKKRQYITVPGGQALLVQAQQSYSLPSETHIHYPGEKWWIYGPTILPPNPPLSLLRFAYVSPLHWFKSFFF
jgi:hypothetical protein